MTVVGINQPHYLPWLLYYERFRRVDIHVVLDHVQFEKNSLVNRNRIAKIGGDPFYLTVPVSTKNQFGNLALNSLLICNSFNWQNKHIKAIEMNL